MYKFVLSLSLIFFNAVLLYVNLIKLNPLLLQHMLYVVKKTELTKIAFLSKSYSVIFMITLPCLLCVLILIDCKAKLVYRI